MAKGASIKFKSHQETVPKLLELLKLEKELKKHDKIILKPHLTGTKETSTSVEFLEQVLKYCLTNKNHVSEVFIAEGADGYDTEELFEFYGYKKLAEKYDVSLIDLNSSDTEPIEREGFTKFSRIHYPKVLLNSFIIALPKLAEDEETGITGSLSTMLGAFPSSLYRGFFTKRKSKIRNWEIADSIYDITQCKMPDLAVIDASDKGLILAGIPFEMDKQSAKLLGKEWDAVPYLRHFDEFTQQLITQMPQEEKTE